MLFASLIGTTIEFFDFYIYATAAVLVFPKLFFPAADPASATLQSLATFAIAFFARPVGSALFGHFGDRIGRKATLVAALLTMGVSTVAIGLLPTYAAIGVAAPLLLALCRFGQGLGLGGEWGGAVLLATENAPPGKRAWYGMFPQLGAPIGFFLSGGVFLLLSRRADATTQFFAWGWRMPFLASAVLVLVGLYVRLTITETPVFQQAIDKHERVQVPMLDGASAITRAALVLGTFVVAGDLRAVLPDDGVRAVAGARARSATRASSSCRCSWSACLSSALTIPIVGACSPTATAAARVLIGATIGDRRVRPGAWRRCSAGGTVGAVLFAGARPGADGPDLRSARHGAGGAVPDRGALHRQLADLQPRRHLRRVAGAVHRHLAGQQLRPAATSATTCCGGRCDHARLPGAVDGRRGFGLISVAPRHTRGLFHKKRKSRSDNAAALSVGQFW